jgi:NTP pyrophosphatase (non-canonical NTP hydrolase)
MTAGPYAIGSDHCPGLSKLAEEAGEVVQVVGKIVGAGGMVKHWDGSDLRERLEEEIADALAACLFVIKVNSLDAERIHKRKDEKLDRFREWHLKEQPLDPFAGRRAANAVYVHGRRQFVRFLGSDSEYCALCQKPVALHYTDGRPTYFCDHEDEP